MSIGWQPMKTVPADEIVLLGTWVKHARHKDSHAEYYAGYFEWESGKILGQNGDDELPFDEKEDYDFWMPIPELPEVK